MGRRIVVFFALLLGICPATVNAEESSPLWIAVTTAALRPAVEPLCEHRRADGMDVHVVITDELANANAGNLSSHIKHEIETLRGDRSSPTFVLLIGSAAESVANAGKTAVVPMPSGSVGRMKGQPTDHDYSLCGKDLMPTVAVGRFPARSAAESAGDGR